MCVCDDLKELREENESLKDDIEDLKNWVAQLIWELRGLLTENDRDSAKSYVDHFNLLSPEQRKYLGLS